MQTGKICQAKLFLCSSAPITCEAYARVLPVFITLLRLLSNTRAMPVKNPRGIIAETAFARRLSVCRL